MIPAVVVGSGFGCRIQIPALRGAGFEVVGLVGTDAARTSQRAADNLVPQAYTDLDEAIEQTGRGLVAVSTPPYTHGPLILKALSHGCHVLCEKPFARDAAEARTMLKAAEGAGVVHALGNEFRFEPERAAISRTIAEGKIGEPRFFSFTQYLQWLIGDEKAIMPDWWFDVAEGGGWLGAWGSHLVDWIREWLGEIESVSAVVSVLESREAGADDSFTARFRLANGAEGVMQQTAASWGPHMTMVRVAGNEGSIWLDGATAWIADRAGTRKLAIPGDLELPPPPPSSTDPRLRNPDWEAMNYLELGPYTRLCESIHARIEGRVPPSPVPFATFADGVVNMEVLDAIRASSAKGGELVRLR